jgi:hypothetical protein
MNNSTSPSPEEGAARGFRLRVVLYGGGFYVGSVLFLLWCGADVYMAIGASAGLAPLAMMAWLLLSLMVGAPLTNLLRQPALLGYLYWLKQELAPEGGFLRAWKRRNPPVLHRTMNRWLLSTLRGGAFVQESVARGPDESDSLWIPSLAARGECRVLVANDGHAYWAMSQNGRACLTSDDSQGWPTGDPAFDQVVQMVGSRPKAMAVLTPELRAQLVTLLDGRFGPWQKVTLQCRPVAIQFSPALEKIGMPRFHLPSGRLLSTIIDALVPFLNQLEITEADLVPALLANAAADPEAGVRRRTLDALLSLAPGPAVLEKAMVFASQDEDTGVRVWAAKVAGDEWGLRVLTDVAGSSTAGAALRFEAIVYLVAHQPIREVWPAVVSFWHLADSGRRRAVFRDLLGRADPSMFALLSDYIRQCDADFALDLLALLGSCRNAPAEEILLGAIESEIPAVRLAAVQALGERGTARVMPALVDLEDDPYLGRAAKDAVVKIRIREGIADVGRLSMVDDIAGAMSLVGEAGSIEIADDRDRKSGRK